MCLVSTCCFFKDLEEGSVIIAWALGLFSVFRLVWSIATMEMELLILASSLAIFIASLLVTGVVYRRKTVLKLWLILSFLNLLVDLGLGIWLLVASPGIEADSRLALLAALFLCYFGKSRPQGQGRMSTVKPCLAGLNFYFWCVIYSYCEQLILGRAVSQRSLMASV